MKFIARTPFFRLSIPLVLGILCYEYFKGFSPAVLLLLAIFSILLLAFGFRMAADYKKRWLFGLGVFLFFFVLAYAFSLRKEKALSVNYFNRKGCFLVELQKNVIEKQRSYQLEVKIKEFYNSSQIEQVEAKAFVYLSKDSNVSQLLAGDYLLLDAEFFPPQPIAALNNFDYVRYLRRKGVVATAYVKPHSWKKVEPEKSFSVFRFAGECRNKFLGIFKKHGIVDDEFSVLASLCFAAKDELSADLQSNYALSGAMHLLAVSGLHVGILYGLLLYLFSFLNKNFVQRALKALFILSVLWFYAFVTGLQPSVSRAALMFSLAMIATLFNRKSEIYNTIFLSAFLILCFNPNLLFQPSFQLSYSAVLSIVFFQPKIAKFFTPKNKILKWFWELTAVSLAVQMGTMPLVLYYFHAFPNYFLLSNWLGIPLAVLILPSTLALLIFSSVPYLSFCIAFVLNVLLKILNFSIAEIAKLPYVSSPAEITVGQVFLIFAALFFISYYFYSKKYFSLISFFAVFLIFVSVQTYRRYNRLQTECLLLYSSSDDTRLNFVAGEKRVNFLLSNKEDYAKEGVLLVENKEIREGAMFLKSVFGKNAFFLFNDKRLLLLADDLLKNKQLESPLSVDVLLLTNAVSIKLENLLNCVHPKGVVLDGSISFWYAEAAKEYCEKHNIPFHSLRQDGVYRLSSKKGLCSK